MNNKRNLNKYSNYAYSNEINEILNKTSLSDLDNEKIKNIIDINKNRIYYPIIKDIYILAYKNKLSSAYLADIYNVSLRTLQYWLKDMNLNRDIKDNIIVRKNKINKEYNEKIEKNLILNDDKIYGIYRFLDENKRVLYIWKCRKTYKGKEYFLRERITQHFSPSSNQLPKSLYLNIKYIEVFYPDVKSDKELEELESALISYYERNKLECFYNKDLIKTYELLKDDYKWEKYYTLNNVDINNLKEKYEYEDIPNIEIINERLKAILWIINNKVS